MLKQRVMMLKASSKQNISSVTTITLKCCNSLLYVFGKKGTSIRPLKDTHRTLPLP